MTYHVTETRDGLRIIVADDESDSLAVIEVTRRHGSLMGKLGLRGNYDAHKRPHRPVYTTMDAPTVSPQDRAMRRADWFRRNHWRFR